MKIKHLLLYIYFLISLISWVYFLYLLIENPKITDSNLILGLFSFSVIISNSIPLLIFFKWCIENKDKKLF